jgi:HTH-type transcriptional regulator / antitoxin HipB
MVSLEKDLSLTRYMPILSRMKDTTLRNAEQLGTTIRLKRKEQSLSQAALAAQLGVERKWVLRLEAGNPKAELGLVLKTLSALGIQATLSDQSAAQPRTGNAPPPSRLDEVFRRLQRPARK